MAEQLGAAIAVAQAQGARLLELRSAHDLARLTAMRGVDDAARRQLRQALAAMPQDSKGCDVREARALLGSFGG